MRLLELPIRPRAIEDLQAASAVGQGKLYRVYDELLRDRGLTSAQVLLTFFDMSARTHYVNARRTLRKLLDWRIVPVINENDTTTTDQVSFGDNDFLAAQVAVLTGADLLVLLTDTGGLYTADPRVDPSATLVDLVEDPEALGVLEIGHATSPLGSGGMRSKVVAADMATSAGISTVIASGLEPGVLAARWAGEATGTRFAPRPSRQSSFKLWLRTRSPPRARCASTRAPRGRCGRAARRCCRSGIVEVRGRFDAGDAVEVQETGDGRGRQGDLQLLGGRAAARDGPQVRRGARGAAARDRGSGPPGLLRAAPRPLPASLAWPSPRPSVTEICLAARAASRALATMSTADKDAALLRVADALEARAPEILEANARDLEAGREAGLSDALMDRLALDPARIAAIADARALDRRAARPRRRGDRRPPAGQRARRAQGARAARRHRGGLRGAAERDRRRRRAVPEVRQRDRAARLVERGALQRRARLDRRARRVPGRRGLARRRRRPRAARRAGGPGGRRRPDHPARRRGPEEGADRGRDACR